MIGCLCVYNEARMIERAIASLQGCERLIVVDGAYADYPGIDIERPGSTDGTLDLICVLRPDAEIIEAAELWPGQAKKRNRYLVGGAGDWYIVLDGDEQALGLESLKALIRQIDGDRKAREVIGWIEVCISRSGRERYIYSGHRAFRHVDGLHYLENHHDLRDARRGVTAPILGRSIDMSCCTWRSAWLPRDEFQILHFKDERPEERLEQQALYYRTRTWR